MTINEIQDNVIEEFSAFDDWMDKYSLLIDLGNSLPALDERYKTESNLIEGCQSRVWLQADYVDGKIIFQGESDAVIVKGIVSLLISVPKKRFRRAVRRSLCSHLPRNLFDPVDTLLCLFELLKQMQLLFVGPELSGTSSYNIIYTLSADSSAIGNLSKRQIIQHIILKDPFLILLQKLAVEII